MVDRIAQNLELQVDKPGITAFASPQMSEAGFQVVIDWYLHQIMKGRGFQINAGNISAPLIGDAPLIDATAEMAVDVANDALTVFPVSVQVGFNLMAGTVMDFKVNSVATVSSGGDAFVPLPLKSNGVPSGTTARVDAAGGVAVTADLATTTVQHTSAGAPIIAGAFVVNIDWQPRVPAQLVGPRCFYMACGATGTGPSYFASIDYLELPSAELPA